MDGYWKGRTAFQLKTAPTRRYHSKAPPDNTAVSKGEPEHTEAQSLSGSLYRTHKGHLISILIMEGHWIQSWWPFVTLMTLDFTKLCWNYLRHLKGKLVNSEHQTLGFTLQLRGFDFIMYQEEHSMSQTKLKSHMIFLDRIDWHCPTKLILTRTESHAQINGALTIVEMLVLFGLDWLCFRLRTAYRTLLWNKKRMTKQQEMPRRCLGQRSLLSSNEQHTTLHTYHIVQSVNTAWRLVRTILHIKLTDSLSFKLTTVLSTPDRMLDNKQFSLP